MARRKQATDRTTIGPELEKLAHSIAASAMDDKITFDQKTDAFKVLTNYYAMVNKLGPQKTEGTFNGHAQQIESALGGGGPAIETESDRPDF